MDTVNRFHTEQTWRWVRTEQVALVFALSVFGALHAREVAWTRFVAAFVVIDLVGYLPGALASRRSASGRIHPIYHHLYNLTHNYLTAGIVVALWAMVTGGFEWAMLALPIHLSGDRGVFGNTFKPVSLPFEPVHPLSEVDVPAAATGGVR
jgi:hypothetical protein